MLSSWRISWRNSIRNKKRLVFSCLAIILGTAFVTTMLIADRTTKDVFTYYEEMYVGNADYWLLSDEYEYSDEMAVNLAEYEEVNDILLALDKQTFLEFDGDYTTSQRSVRITGVSDQASPLLKLPIIKGELDNEGLVITNDVASLLDVTIGDSLAFAGMGELPIAAIVEFTQLLSSPTSWERAESASFRVMAPLDWLQENTGQTEELSYIRFNVRGEDERFVDQLQTDLEGTEAYLLPVVADDLQNNDISGLYTFFYLIAFLAIFISGFIVFNMIYTSVIERKKEFAIMKSLGYLQGSISKLVFIEVGFLAVVGTVIGVPLGIWLGDLFMLTLLNVFEFDMVYTLNWVFPALIATGFGFVFPVLFSLFPIYLAGKTSIMELLKGTSAEGRQKKQRRVRLILAIVFIAVGLFDSIYAMMALLVGLVLLFPYFLAVFTIIFKPISKRLFKHPGLMAHVHVAQQLNRNGNTASILAVGVAVVLLLSAAMQGAPEGYDKQIRAHFGGNMRVTSESPWTEADREEIAAIAGVSSSLFLREAEPITWKTAEGVEREFSVMGISEDGPALFDEADQIMTSGSTIVLGERAFVEWGGEQGDLIDMYTPNGLQSFEVTDVVSTSHYSGYVAFMEESALQAQFGWENAFDLLLTVEDQETAEQVRTQLWNEYSNLSSVTLVEEEVDSTTSAFEGMNYLMLLLILIIALASIGTANTLMMNTMERSSEIGTMRAIGFTKNQVKRMVLLEGALIGLAGVSGGVIAGMILLYQLSHSALMEGFIRFHIPLDLVMLTVITGVVLSLVASWLASKMASQIELQQSLKEG
ncbi:LOW QUALITY PROTEIN: hypothetical protein JCM19046_4945 [Bacillus sp. JCM 19046]|nr:LOW QUALITY PROTEIN: hypothetical protein JCM19045_564 [Bacillus sp. JCM 19045]GAF20236.1 LOW QUALITY PROTEIN: hypothetical protein JCM19046_4945 [Bacillus sp. JCM 19046]